MDDDDFEFGEDISQDLDALEDNAETTLAEGICLKQLVFGFADYLYSHFYVF